MSSMSSRIRWLAAGAAIMTLAACGGGGDSGGGGSATPTATPTSAPTSTPTSTPAPSPSPSPAPSAGQTTFSETKLVSDTAAVGGSTIDPNLVNAWGIVFAPNAPVWVNNNGTSKSTLYDGNGAIQSLVVAIPPGANSAGPAGGNASPTGIVANTGQGFVVSENGKSGPAAFIFVGEQGTISGWSQNVDNSNAITTVDNSASGAVYKGVAIVAQGGTNELIVPNFHSGAIEVYDTNFQKTSTSGSFTDPNLPAGYAPFNAQAVGTTVFVAYAHTANNFDDDDGPGLGLIDEFDASGAFLKRLVDVGGALNAPWGMAMAPANFGSFSNDLLVGNFGDGKINVFDPNTGAMVGTVSDANGNPLVIDKLWGIAFGNGAFAQPTNTLFFAAGPNDEQDGLYGRIDMAGTFTPVQPGAPGY